LTFPRIRAAAALASLLLLAGASTARAASVPRFERQFLGIRLMSRGNMVLRKYGTPTRVLVTNLAILYYQTVRLPDRDFLTVSVTPLDPAAGGPAAGGNPYAPGGNPYAPGANPYSPGGPASPPPGIESQGGTTAQAGKYVFWIYQYPKKGITNVFVLDEEGRVAQIAQVGGRASARTARAVAIGSPYSSVVRAYGFPERHEKVTTQGALQLGLLSVSYEESHGVQFFFLNQPLRGYGRPGGAGPWCVGIIVSAVG
jgi:hypothetical protein